MWFAPLGQPGSSFPIFSSRLKTFLFNRTYGHFPHPPALPLAPRSYSEMPPGMENAI